MGISIALLIFVASTGIAYFALGYFAEETGNGPQIEGHQEKELSATDNETGPGTRQPQDDDDSTTHLMVSLLFGAGMSVVGLVLWEASARMKGNAATVLLEEGLDDMTVRDVELVGRMMEMEEFTVPELVKKARVSRSSVWRLVRKMVDEGLVEETEKEKLPDSGRGKPRKVYRYSKSHPNM
jgi:hypothetical protein